MTHQNIVRSRNRAREETPPASTHLEHELAAEVARLAQPMRVGGLRQAIELDLRRENSARLEQFDDAIERPAGTLDRGPERGNIVAGGLRRLCTGGGEGSEGAGLEHRTRKVRR